jgi:DNA-binding transcriptional MerR regulator
MTPEKNEKQSLLRIGEVAKILGLSKQVVQYYLMLGLITETSRSVGGHRLFDQTVIQRIKLIHKLNHSGYTLSEIRETFIKPKKREK